MLCVALGVSWEPRSGQLRTSLTDGILLTMNLDEALHDLRQALDEQAEPAVERRIRSARRVLVARGEEALGMEHTGGHALHDLITIAVGAPSTVARRAFAVLIVHALGVDGLVESKLSRGQFDRNLSTFIESALPTILQRSGYPFGNETYEKRRSLERLHTIIDELLKPLEPTFPPNVQGLYAG
jgi:hypothetical protein